MRRREVITLLGGAAAAWPLAGRAQQAAVPVIGFLGPGTLEPAAHLLAVFRRALAEAGYVEGQNVTIEYRFAENRSDRLPQLAADLVRQQVAVIVCGATDVTALVAKAATTSIPILFGVVEDPVERGLVTSLARPGGNATGVHYFLAQLGVKTLGLLHELVPVAARIGLLANPNNLTYERVMKDVTAAGLAVGVQVDIVQASNDREIEAAFVMLARNKVDALLVAPDTLFFNRRLLIVLLATRNGLPAIYTLREYAAAGGLMSYGTSLTEVYRQYGVYAGRILKGAKPADLPVVQSTRFELVINLPATRAIGLQIPDKLLALADEVIE